MRLAPSCHQSSYQWGLAINIGAGEEGRGSGPGLPCKLVMAEHGGNVKAVVFVRSGREQDIRVGENQGVAEAEITFVACLEELS
ncbi:hypothetical protein FCM35_KLT09413 [Carex littledalei]|uniref:Uncharacterized protein n=1 Tax=Carex littledalei TaxID=544730 RepID=A0A833RFY5_9POAL|nr:hypothetical protein FCM35_KLT09413 [Carex littledalei]